MLRDNDIEELPPEIGKLTKLKELHLQCNQLAYFPPELGIRLTIYLNISKVLFDCVAKLNFYDSARSVFRAEGNPLLPDLQEKLKIGPKHILEYLQTAPYARQKQLESIHTIINTSAHIGQWTASGRRPTSLWLKKTRH